MRTFTLANVLLERDDLLDGTPEVIWRLLAGSADGDPATGGLLIDGEVDFTTYLNALSIGKWRRYAEVGDVSLHLELSGGACDVYGTWLEPRSREVSRGKRPLVSLGGSDAIVSADVALPVPEGAHIVSFALRTRGPVRLLCARYVTEVEDADVRDVRLALATTTFRKERYITRNIELVRAQILDSDEPVASAFQMLVVDNGRTLDADALSGGGVSVIPNPNVGGSGGFARGMMEALDRGATHVLLMDDDVRILPESIKRTFSLLCLARGRYADALVEGAMLNLEDPSLQFEDVARIKRDGMYGRVKGDLRIDTVEGVTTNESVDVELPRAYGAWWYCCIPTDAVREHGLPLPLFVRCDDVEYGMRLRPTIMTMNGICVWHERFEGRFRASVDSYQLTRNFLIMAAAAGLDRHIVRAFMLRFSRTFHIYLRAMNYDTCELMLDGLADYLKGPSFIEHADGEALMARNARHNERLVDLGELDADVVAQAVPARRYLGQGRDRGMLLKVLEMLPHDRHALPDWLLSGRPAAVYYSRGAYPARRTMRRRTLVAYDQTGTKAHVRTLDRDRWQGLRERYRDLMDAYRARGEEVARQYRDAAPRLASRAFWESYLDERGASAS